MSGSKMILQISLLWQKAKAKVRGVKKQSYKLKNYLETNSFTFKVNAMKEISMSYCQRFYKNGTFQTQATQVSSIVFDLGNDFFNNYETYSLNSIIKCTKREKAFGKIQRGTISRIPNNYPSHRIVFSRNSQSKHQKTTIHLHIIRPSMPT